MGGPLEIADQSDWGCRCPACAGCRVFLSPLESARLDAHWNASLRLISVRLLLRTQFLGHGNMVLVADRSEEHTSELQSHLNLVCRLLLDKKNLYWTLTQR